MTTLSSAPFPSSGALPRGTNAPDAAASGGSQVVPVMLPAAQRDAARGKYRVPGSGRIHPGPLAQPLAIDLYCGLGGWTEGFLSEGYRVVGFDIERHDYGTGGYPGELVLRDVRSIHGAELVREYGIPAVIVGSSPCQEFSYRAMPWKRAKALPPPYLGIELFQAQFRIQREASEASGQYIPLVVENVRGAQKWVGRAKWHFGSYYLWGDVPALMPITFDGIKGAESIGGDVPKGTGQGSWFFGSRCDPRDIRRNDDGEWSRLGIKQAGISGVRNNGHGDRWFQDGAATFGSRSQARRAASAQIAKIPFPLAQHIARCFKPVLVEGVAQ